jgi:hypothetical protein
MKKVLMILTLFGFLAAGFNESIAQEEPGKKSTEKKVKDDGTVKEKKVKKDGTVKEKKIKDDGTVKEKKTKPDGSVEKKTKEYDD